MLYLIKWNCWDTAVYAIWTIALIVTLILLKRCIVIHKKNSKSNIYIFAIIALLFLLFFEIISIFAGIGIKLYGLNMYKNGKYEIVEGEIENIEYKYQHNSRTVQSLKFTVDNVNFNINNNLLSSGYSYSKGIINKNGERFKIYYIEPFDENEVTYILRIDAAE